jgi:anthranilate phosphoribosyltransferase
MPELIREMVHAIAHSSVETLVAWGQQFPAETEWLYSTVIARGLLELVKDNRLRLDEIIDIFKVGLAEDAIAALRGQLDSANARTERVEADRVDERRRANDLRAQIAVLNTEMAVTARDVVQKLERAEAKRKALGRLKRAWEAWRER